MQTNELIVCCAFLIIGTLAICAVIAFGQAEETQLTVLSDSSLYEGGEVVVQLTTVNGTPIANQSIGVDVIDFDGNVKTLNQTTDEEGKATFDLGDSSAGEYTLECVFRGNNFYKQSNCTSDLEIKEEVKEYNTQSSRAYDPGAYYSPQYGRTFYTGDVIYEEDDGQYHRHYGNNHWGPV